MKKSLSEKVASMLKSLTGGVDNSKIKKAKKDAPEDSPVKDDEESEDDDFDIDDDEEDDVVEKGVKKSWDDLEDGGGDKEIITNGDAILKSFTSNLESMKKRVVEQDKAMLEMSKALSSIGEAVYAIGGSKIPARSLLAKSMTASDSPIAATVAQKDYDIASEAIHKACVANRIDELKSAMIMTNFRKCMVTGEPMNAEYYDTLCKEVARTRKEKEAE